MKLIPNYPCYPFLSGALVKMVMHCAETCICHIRAVSLAEFCDPLPLLRSSTNYLKILPLHQHILRLMWLMAGHCFLLDLILFSCCEKFYFQFALDNFRNILVLINTENSPHAHASTSTNNVLGSSGAYSLSSYLQARDKEYEVLCI